MPISNVAVVFADIDKIPTQIRQVGAGALLVAMLVGFYLAGRGDPLERAISRGDFAGARLEIRKLRGADRNYGKGRLEEAQRSFRAGAQHYAAAVRLGDRHGFERLVSMTRAAACAARAAAARELGDLDDQKALPALETLEQGKFADEGEDTALGATFGCSSRRAARDALQQLRQTR